MIRPEEPESTTDYRGVAGWLLWLCFALTVFNPLLMLISLVRSYFESAPYFGRFPGLGTVFAIETVLTLAVGALSVYAGVGLGQVRPHAVLTAKRYFVCLLAYQAIISVLPFIAGLPSEANQEILKQAAKDGLRTILGVAIWYTYLSKSRRVRATYG